MFGNICTYIRTMHTHIYCRFVECKQTHDWMLLTGVSEKLKHPFCAGLGSAAILRCEMNNTHEFTLNRQFKVANSSIKVVLL